MFDRWIALIGEDNLNIIKGKRILLLGVGGVGAHAAEALVRSGIVELTIVDDDIVDESNLNRQLVALHSTIGLSKVQVMKERLEDINPEVHVVAICERVQADLSNISLLNYDYILDCIDDLDVKVALAKYALSKKCNLVLSTGTARKMKPELLEMTTLDKTSYDPLARKMRSLLKGWPTNRLTVLASTEEPIDVKSGVLGSSSFVPSVGGIMMANYVIRDILNHNM